MYHASFGAYLIDTIAWAVGTTVSFISQLKVYCSILLFIYILSVASGHHFSILLLSLTPHHLTDYLTYHLTRAPALVPHDWGARDHSYDPVTDHPILTIDFSRDQACDLSRDTM